MASAHVELAALRMESAHVVHCLCTRALACQEDCAICSMLDHVGTPVQGMHARLVGCSSIAHSVIAADGVCGFRSG